ncbi:MAG: DEAD/DEAH box helicase, partial [Burkholderiales bacterium]
MSSLQDMGIAPATLTRLNKLGIRTPFDLVLHLPLRYDDETRVVQVSDLLYGQMGCLEVEVMDVDVQYRPKRTLRVRVRDASGELTLRFLNFYGSQIRQLAAGTRLRLLGELRQGHFGSEMVHPKYQVIKNATSLPQTLTPVYPTTAGLSQVTLRRCINLALSQSDLADTLPKTLRDALQLAPFADSVKLLHHPHAEVSQQQLDQRDHPAWRRLKFDELLAQQISMRLHYRARLSLRAPPLVGVEHQRERFLKNLPFSLTHAQCRVLREIESDLARPYPMHRLLQGDVGSGKTVVAALACLRAISAGFQAALMAPTEILTEQHFRKIEQLLQPLGVSTVWITSSLRKKEKTQALQQIT